MLRKTKNTACHTVVISTRYSIAFKRAKSKAAAQRIARELRTKMHDGGNEAERRRNRREVSITVIKGCGKLKK